MKKFLSIVLSLCLIMAVIPIGTFSFTASAAGYTSGYYTYTPNTVYDGAFILDVNTSISGDVTIPSTLGGYKVIGISTDAFLDCTKITSVTIPDSVTSIDFGAFQNCTGLVDITIPNSVKIIEYGAFYGCTSLESITLPFVGRSRIYDSTFDYIFGDIPSSLRNVTITDATQIPPSAFSGGSNLMSITIHGSVISIGDRAFENCTGLVDITIPDGVTSIGESAFENCENLKSITIPDSVTSIGDSAFYNCKSLESITIGDSVTSIGDSAFENCKKLTSITIPDGVTRIGEEAFYNCDSLTSITIPDSVTSIGAYAFDGCTSLESIIVDENNGVYHSDNNCLIKTATKTLISGCKNSIIPTDGSVTSIGNRAFSGCRGLTSITIPGSVTSIDNYAFSGCELLTDVWYTGSETDKASISIRSGNTYLTDATWHYTEGWIIETEAICIENGLKVISCKVCHEKKEEEIPALGHSYSDWKTEVRPTCAKTGLQVKTCALCGERQEQVLPIADHNYSVYLSVTAATCNQSGSRIIKCAWCSEKITTETSTNHIYKDGKCVSCDISTEVVESEHDYAKNTNQTWTVTKENATLLSVLFSDNTETEKKYDIIYIYDGADNLIGEYSGTTLAGQTITVSGDTVKIRLKSDSSVQKYGFHATITPISTIGDTNGDGAVNALDMLNIQDAILMGVKTDAYDITGDGLVNLLDLVRIKKILAGKA